MSFAGDVRKAVDDYDRQISLFVRKVAFDALSGCVKLTPVDTGYARGNWRVVLGPANGTSIPRGEVSRRSKSGAPPAAEMAKIRGFKVGKDQAVYIFNNTAYIGFLDRGSSAQNRTGIVGPVMVAIKAALESGGTPVFTDIGTRGV